MVLERIQRENDIQKIAKEDLPVLAQEIREFLVEKISRTGGHLASNLGVVELTMAMHLCFHLPEDKIIWDVGHQSYTHKILTGRREGFDELRKYGGMSGFPKRKESQCDAFNTGHSSTSISAGLGYVEARDIRGEDYHVISVIGDGALTGGMAFEALNNASHLEKNFIIVLNDNQMSISQNVGGMSRYLDGIRTADAYTNLKKGLEKAIRKIPSGGDQILSHLRKTKSSIKQLFVPGMFFEDMGITYLGPVDGHNLKELIRAFREAKKVKGPVLLHVLTKKGKGYLPAEKEPSRFHGTEPFDIRSGKPLKKKEKDSYTDVFAKVMYDMGEKEPSLVAITAAMEDGTGLAPFHRKYRNRCFDVGIAEGHAVTFAAGLAAGGLKPVFAVYSSFLQRAFDQIIHDVNLLKENVVLAIDRAGFVPADGETHQGIFDPAFLSQVGIPVYSPSNYAELRHWLPILLSDEMQGPRAIRYPRGGESVALAQFGCSGREYDRLYTAPDAKAVMVSYADEVEDVLTAAKLLGKENVPCDVYKLVKIYPFTPELISEISRYDVVLFAEECVACGGIGEHLEMALQKAGWQGAYIHRGVEDVRLPHATVPQIKQSTGLDAEHLAQAIRTWKGAES